MIQYAKGYYRRINNQTSIIARINREESKQIPIFCVNLERAKDRRSNIEKEWITKLKLNIIFWKAYDRRDIEQDKHIFEYDKNQTKIIIGRELSSGEVACITSFASLYQHIIDSNLEEVIIMEDDIIPLFNNRNELFSIIQQGKVEYPDAEMMLLHQYPNFSTTQCDNHKSFFSLCTKVPWGNQFFYANKEGIMELYNLIVPIRYPADFPQRRLASKQKVIMVNKPLCFHHWGGPLATTYIGNDIRKTYRLFIE
jgi:GR25 family glycosyltransferase involved in LPS biosynthesis